MRSPLPLLTASLLLLAACAADEPGSPPPTASAAQALEVTETFRASSDYSSTQGHRGWYYLSGTGQPLTYNAQGNWQGNETYLLVYGNGAHPGGSAAAVRKWVAPRPGRARITGEVHDTSTSCGDGVAAHITMGAISAPAVWSRHVPNGTTSPQWFDVTLDVLAGTELFFIVGKNGDNSCDWTAFDPTISLTSDNDTGGTVFSSAGDARNPAGRPFQGYRGWTYETEAGEPLQWDPTANRWRKAPWMGGDPWLLLWATGGHPGNTSAAVRKWTSPVAGEVTITGTIADDDPNCGDGAEMVIVRTTHGGDEVIWRRRTTEGVGTGKTWPDNTFTVKTAVTRGAVLRFGLGRLGDNGCDSSTFDPTITLTSSGSFYSAEPARALPLYAPSGNKFEVPPFIVAGGWRQYFVNTGWTDSCATPRNPLAEVVGNPVLDGETTCTRVSDRDLNTPWARNYYGAYSHFVIGGKLVALNHGENKNECYEESTWWGEKAQKCHPNTVDPEVTCAAASPCNQTLDAWASYNGFVNLSWQYYDEAHNWGMQRHNDEGPILWPANGYTAGGVPSFQDKAWYKKSSEGLQHPHGFVNDEDGYFYVFFHEIGYVDEDPVFGRRIKVARAPIANDGWRHGEWKVFCGPGCWTRSLPPGFDKSTIDRFYSQRGGPSRGILPDGDAFSFAIARAGAGFLGVAEKVVGNMSWELRLYAATSLEQQDWRLVGTIRQQSRRGPKGYVWAGGDMHYPVFLSANGWSSTNIDPKAFYLLGATSDKETVFALPVSLNGAGGTVAYVTRDTTSATKNTKSQKLYLTAGEQLTAGTCAPGAAYSGDTYLRFHGPTGALVAWNDDSCGLGSQLTYVAPTTGWYRLDMGCYASGECSGTVIWSLP